MARGRRALTVLRDGRGSEGRKLPVPVTRSNDGGGGDRLGRAEGE